MIKYILFDLDGTLLPINQTKFIKAYFTELAKKIVPMGYDKEKLIETIWTGTMAMMKNDGSCSNRDAFWKVLTSILGEEAGKLEDIIDTFYLNEFDRVKEIQFAKRDNKALIDGLKEKGYEVVLATSPIFPAVAIRTRLKWINLTPEDFKHVTTYENCHFGKLNLSYYEEILEKCGFEAQNCIMIGNNPVEDMCFERLGGKAYLVTDDVENPDSVPADKYKSGSFEELKKFLEELPQIS